MNIDEKPYLLLPIETKVREFQGKVLLSCFAAERGFNVLLADQNEMLRLLNCLPRGIYIDKGIVRTYVKNFRKNRKIGNRVVAWCEEGLSFRVPETYLKERISIEAYGMTDYFFAWGRYHAEIVAQKLCESSSKVICTGNPRFDLLREPYRSFFLPEKERIRRSFGRFILINTNFSRYNHFYGRDFAIKNLKEGGRIGDKNHEEFLVKWADYLGEMYHKFIEMSVELNKALPDRSIIIRPHPSESLETWKKAIGSYPNIKVVQDGNVIPWIMASDVMIHNSCTTGVESYILGEPVISYCPITSEIYDCFLPNSLSRKTFDLDELVLLIREAIADPGGFVERVQRDSATKEVAERYISGISGPFACDNIVEMLRKLVDESPSLRIQEKISFLENGKRQMDVRLITAKRLLKRMIMRGRGIDAYMKQKFPGLELQEVVKAIELFRETSNRFHDVTARTYPGMHSCFLISQDAR
ncbi:MAG: hypothetical protein CVU64_23820 [Deltaproteobacteria bacterium HGW-Deltaproteobacteria-21]|nr:MAG: hypothetical protein CVU64_23820 [Deltaproteobacteria bacterium HGW-Deltaproteobacteria-21]